LFLKLNEPPPAGTANRVENSSVLPMLSGSGAKASFGAVCGVTVDVTQAVSAPVADEVQPVGKAGAVTESKFWSHGAPVGVAVGVAVFVAVAVGVFVAVGVPVGVFTGVLVGVFVGVLVGVFVGVFVGVALVTLIAPDMPVIETSTVSVAVMVWLPSVVSVAWNVCAPASAAVNV
jgi:hypothetical protein